MNADTPHTHTEREREREVAREVRCDERDLLSICSRALGGAGGPRYAPQEESSGAERESLVGQDTQLHPLRLPLSRPRPPCYHTTHGTATLAGFGTPEVWSKGRRGGEGCTARRATVPPLLALDLSLLWALPHSSSSRRIAAMAPCNRSKKHRRGTAAPATPRAHLPPPKTQPAFAAGDTPARSLAPHSRSLARNSHPYLLASVAQRADTQAQRRPATPRGLTSHLNLDAAPHQAPVCRRLVAVRDGAVVYQLAGQL